MVLAKGNFWGRTITASGASDDPSRYTNFGPFTPGFELVEYNNLDAVEDAFKQNPNVAGLMFEPIQGEAGVLIPHDGYLKGLRSLCDKYNVLLILDEVQTGLGRTGKLMCADWEDVKPDIVSIGKALSGGFLPSSAAMANDEIMLTIKPGEHGSTFGGNPLSSVISKRAVEILFEENMIENSNDMGNLFLQELKPTEGNDMVKSVRGKGLFCSVELHAGLTFDGDDLAY